MASGSWKELPLETESALPDVEVSRDAWKHLMCDCEGPCRGRGNVKKRKTPDGSDWKNFPVSARTNRPSQSRSDSWKHLAMDEDTVRHKRVPAGKANGRSEGHSDSWKHPALGVFEDSVQDKIPAPVLNLTKEILQCMPTVKTDKDNHYVRHGKDHERLSGVLNSKCRCKQNCLQGLDKRTTSSVVIAWHNLSAETHIMLLHGLYGEETSVRHAWQINGHPVCFRGLLRVLGHSNRTLCRFVHGIEDGRSGKNSELPRAQKQADFVQHFLMELYLTAA